MGRAPCLSISRSLLIWMFRARQGQFLKGLRRKCGEVIRGSFGGHSGEFGYFGGNSGPLDLVCDVAVHMKRALECPPK